MTWTQDDRYDAEQVYNIITSLYDLAPKGEVQRLREALEFYANGEHFSYGGMSEGEPENADPEYPNWLSGNGEFDYEDGSIARAALKGES